jgi:hypothetical protein
MPELKSWGERYYEDMDHSDNTHCPNGECTWELNGMGRSAGYFEFIIGFSVEAPGSNRADRIASFIVECPVCFTKYYFHTTQRAVDRCKELGRWPHQ